MKKLAKYLFIFILFNCVMLIACLAFLHFADLNPYRNYVESMATRAMGRQVEINGHFDVNVFPHPEVSINQVTVANAEWGSEPTMVSVGHAEAAVSFLSLFTGRIIVKRLQLNDAIILLETNDHQTGNWVLATAASLPDTKKQKTGRDPNTIVDLPLMVDFAEFGNLTVTARELERADQVYHISSFNLQPDEFGNLILRSSGDLLNNPMTLNGTITSKASVIALGPVDVDLRASLGGIQLTGQLSTSRLATLAELKSAFNITVNDIQNILKKEKIRAPLTGPLTAEATVNYDGSVTRAKVAVNVEGITTHVNGSYSDKQLDVIANLEPLRRVGELFDLKGLSAEALNLKARVIRSDADDFTIEQFQADMGENQFTAQGSINKDGDTRMSMTLLSSNLKTFLNTLPEIEVNATSSLLNSAEKIVVSDLDVTFDKSDISGDLTIIKGDTQEVIAELTSKLLDLRPLSSAVASKAPKEKTPKSKNRYVFTKEPLNLSPLESVETDVKLSVDHFYYDIGELKDVKINASIHDGHVDAKFKCTSPNEGHAAGKIDLKIQDKKAVVDTKVSLTDFRMSVLKSKGIKSEEVPPMGLSIELNSNGSSPRELAAAANGRVLFTQGSGKINNNMMKMVSNDIIMQLTSALNPFAQSEEFSRWDCTVISFNIVNGLATIDGMLAQGEKVMIVGGGGIDLKTEKLNVEFNTKPRSGIGISADMFVAPFVKVQGTLASPGIGLNKKGTLLTGGAAFATGGLSLVLQRAFDRATAEGDYCEEMLKAVGEHTRFSF